MLVQQEARSSNRLIRDPQRDAGGSGPRLVLAPRNVSGEGRVILRNDRTLLVEVTRRELECFRQEDLKHRRSSAILCVEFHVASFVDAVQKLCANGQLREEVLRLSRAYREIPCRADPVFLEYRCPEYHFEGDQLSVVLFIRFYKPVFRVAPVRGLKREREQKQTKCKPYVFFRST